MMRIKYMFKIL